MNPWIIKAGGELLATRSSTNRIIRDLIALARRHPIVFVHGGGPQIEAELKKHRIKIRYAKGRRVTSPETMAVVEKVLSGIINKGVAAALSNRGTAAVGLSCRDGQILTGQLIPHLGRAAAPIKTNTRLINHLLKGKFLPVLCSVASDKMGMPVNVNADDAASALAIALKAKNLIFLTDINGVLNAQKKRIPVLKRSQISSLIKAGAITGGMIPKVQSAKAALDKGVGQIQIVNGTKGIRLESGTKII